MLWRVSMGIAAAQLRHRRRQTFVSTLGVALGVGFFVATSALMSGSEQDMVKRLLDNAPHITIKDEFREAAPQPVFIAFPEGAVTLTNTKPREYLRGIKNHGAMVEELSRQPGVVAEAALMGQAIIRYASKDASAGIAGIDPEKERFLTTIESDMLEGSLMRLKTASQGIVIGQGMSNRLGLGMDDLATVVSPAGLVRRMKVVGIFRTGNLLLDEGQAYMLIKDAQVLLDKPFIANRIRIKITDPDMAEDYASQLESRWGYRTESWQEVNRDFLGLFIVRNIITYSIVGAIMAVAAFGIFNIISTVVMEKRRDIAILMSMGFRAGDIERIFLVQGAFVGLIGMFLGWGLGLILLQMLGTVEITVPGLMDTQKLPLEKGPFQFGVGGAFALVSAVVAAWFPARKAAAVRPVDIIRGGDMSAGGEAPVIELKSVTRILQETVPVTLVRDIDLIIRRGEFVSVTGPSGSGKSSLLYLLGLLDLPTRGQVLIDGVDTTGFSSDRLADVRLAKLGFVFQFHFLLPEFTVLHNVTLPMQRLGQLDDDEIHARGMALLKDFEIDDQAKKRPDQLSGGQRQRVAVARALANDPAVILADEPTGNLDMRNSEIVQGIFADLAAKQGRTVIAVTHDKDFADSAPRNVHLVDGRIDSDVKR